MKTPDVNVLVAAFLSEHPQHDLCHRWLCQHVHDLDRGMRLALLPVVVASFLRLVTNKRIFTPAAPIDQALGFIEALLALPGCEWVSMGAEWPVFAALCRGKSLSANLIPDAWIAASARQQGLTLVTMDRDFMRLLEAHELDVLAAH